MDISRKHELCLDGLDAFARQAGFSEVVLGLSGGLDSAVAAVLCAQVFGPGKVHALMLPGPYSSDHSLSDARDLAQRVGIPADEVPITAAYHAFAEVLAPLCGGSFEGLASENTQARCRMVCLMALSNHYGWMLVNTGNKSEAMMGYSTLYGDMAGAYAPLGGLYKTDVRELACHLNDMARRAGEPEPVPQNIIDKPPSAELAPGQTDEQGLGMPYAQLDRVLIGHFERGLAAADLATDAFDQQAVQQVIDRANACAFKRALEPPYPAIDYGIVNLSGVDEANAVEESSRP